MSGVTVISSGKPGPRVGIMAVTHGDEPAGLSAHVFLMDFFQTHSLDHGILFLIQGNPEAAKQGIICIDENLNRIFQDNSLLTEKQKNSREYTRSRELMPLLASLDYLLDIHSTGNPGPVFSILKTDDPIHREYASILPVEFYSIGWDDIIIGTTCDWVDAHGGVGITIECGQHLDPHASGVAVDAAKIFLQKTGIYNFDISLFPQSKLLQVLLKERVIDKNTFHYKKQYVNFEGLGRDELIAQDSQKVYSVPNIQNAVIIFPTRIESIRSGAISEAYLLGNFL